LIEVMATSIRWRGSYGFFDFMYSISSNRICLSNFNSTFVFQCRKGVMGFLMSSYLSSNRIKSERPPFLLRTLPGLKIFLLIMIIFFGQI
jgi:hypothetical protein